MTRPALLVPVTVRMLAAAAALLALGMALASCGDAEEQVAPGTVAPASPTGTTSESASPTMPTLPTKPPLPSGWREYTDQQLGFSLPHPSDLAISEKISELREQKSNSVIQQRVVAFTRADEVLAFHVASAPNDAGLSLEEWIRKYPGWPSEPKSLFVGGEAAFRFERNALDEPDARAYFMHGDYVLTLAGNVYGSGEGGYGPGISEADFQNVLQAFRFAK